MNLSKEFQSQTEIITVLPILDNSLALNSKEFAKQFVDYSNYPSIGNTDNSSLKLAIALSYYNAHINPYFDPSENSLLANRWEELIREEYKAQLSSKIPPIGIELESHIFPDDHRGEKRLEAYELFFDIIDFPKNNVNDILFASYWEFAPMPSYSALVQESIKEELIKGRFISTVIPAFNKARNPDRIARITKDSLNSGLLSLHGNINIPENLYISKSDRDLHLFSIGFALATSSALRLKNRFRNEFYDIRKGNQIKQGFSDKRLEVCGLELNDKINLKNLQFVATALFSYMLDTSSQLGQPWKNIRRELNNVIGSFITGPSLKEDIALLALRGRKVNTVDLLLNECAKETDLLLADLHQ